MGESNLLAQVRSELATADRNASFQRISILEHLSVMQHSKFLICAVALTVTLIGMVYAFVKPAVYDGNILIAVSETGSAEKNGVLGFASGNQIVRTPMSETEILRSRVIIGSVVDKLNLDSIAEPMYLPFIGKAYARFEQNFISKLFPANQNFRVAPQRIEIDDFDVPTALINQPLTLIYDEEGKYTLQHQLSKAYVSGRVGQILDTRVAGSQLRLLVKHLEGKSGARFTITKVPKLAVVEALRSGLDISEVSKGSGIINVVYSDTDPMRVSLVLNELSRSYFQFVESQTERESLQSLSLLQAQLPKLRERVILAESRYQRLKESHGTVDVAEETRLGLTRSSVAEQQLSELQRKRAEMSVRLGENHPLLVAVNQEINGMSRERNAVRGNISRLPTIARQLNELERVLRSESEIYEAILERMEQIRMVAYDKSTNVRIVDDAVAPLVPRNSRLTSVIFFVVLGIMLGIAAAFLRQLLLNRKKQRPCL